MKESVKEEKEEVAGKVEKKMKESVKEVRSQAWPCAKSKIFRLKFFFPPRRRSPKQPRRSAKQKLKSFCLADQLGCFRQKNLYQPCRLGQSQR